MLWLAVYLPDLPLDVLTRGEPGERLVAVVEGRGARQRVLVAGEAARHRGVRSGMSLAAAWALVPALQALERDLDIENKSIGILASWAGQFTSIVSTVPGQGLLLEVEGSLALFGGVADLWRLVRRGLLELGYRPVLAVAPTPLGAWLLARGGGGVLVTDREALRGRLAALPLACTDLSAGSLVALAGVGVRTLGDLARLPRDGLVRRLGPEVLGLLDRALGDAPDPREPYRSPRTFAARLVLPAETVDVEALLFPLRRLALELGGLLRAVGGGVERVTVGLEHPRPPPTRVTVGLAGPSRDARHLQTLLRERLQRESLRAPVEAVSLKAGRIVDLEVTSRDLFEGEEAGGEAWRQLVDRLRARLGPEAVRGLAPAADHRPERAWHLASADGAEGRVRPAPLRRPLWLLDAPRMLEAEGERPCWGGLLTLREGPERIEGGWWDGEDVARDYYVAEGPGGERLWVYRDRRPPHRWFLHGLFG